MTIAKDEKRAAKEKKEKRKLTKKEEQELEKQRKAYELFDPSDDDTPLVQSDDTDGYDSDEMHLSRERPKDYPGYKSPTKSDDGGDTTESYDPLE